MSVEVLGWLLAGGTLVACATGGAGNNPDFAAAAGDDVSGGGVTAGQASDDSSAGNPASDDGGGGPSGAGICPNDAPHNLAAFLAGLGVPTPCISAADCAAGQCCSVGMTASVCVMQ